VVGIRLIAILEPIVDELVLVSKILAVWLVGKFLHRPAVGRDEGRLLAAHPAAALLVGEGKGAPEGDRAKQRAAHHEGAPSSDRHCHLGTAAWRRKDLTLVEEIGVGPLALIEVLGRPARLVGRAQRDLRRLVVNGVEGLQLPARIALRHLPRLRGHHVVLCGLLGEGVEALVGRRLRLSIAAAVEAWLLLMGEGRTGREARVRKVCVEALLGEARVGKALIAEALIGKIGIGKVLFGEARLREARITRIRILQARPGEV
jgi:hypothetical protein